MSGPPRQIRSHLQTRLARSAASGVRPDVFEAVVARFLEAQLASQIAAGQTLADIACEQGSGRETLRSQLKAVFDKTGTARQAGLVLLLSKLAAPAAYAGESPDDGHS